MIPAIPSGRYRSALGPAALILGLVAAPGCATVDDPPPAALPEDPAEALRAIEARLIGAEAVRVDTEIRAQGLFDADLAGPMRFAGEDVDLDVRGSFVGRPADLHLAVEDGLLTGGNGDHRFETSLPAELREALVVGLIRRGALHNLWRLSGAMIPERAEGGAGDGLDVVDARWDDAAGADDGALRAVVFGLVVDGRDTAEVRLWIDPRTALPARREDTVRFDHGRMTVVERYRDWTVVDLNPAGSGR